MILDVHAHVGKPNYAYRASEFTNEDLAARMKASDVSTCCVFSFYDVIFNIAFVSAAAFAALALPADGASPAVFAVISVGYALTAATYGLATRRLADRRPVPTT